MGRHTPSDIQLKRALGRVLSRSPRRDRRVVLLYHSIESGPASLSASNFESHLSWLSDHASVIPLEKLMTLPDRTSGLHVSITFDDGYESLLRKAAPLLSERGWGATAFLSVRHIKKVMRDHSSEALGHYPDERFLIWQEVKELESCGWEIGSHGMAHLDLTQMDSVRGTLEVKQSKETIEDVLGHPCTSFAYTWGHHNRRVRQLVKKVGYQYAAGAVHGGLTSGSDPFAFPRIDIRKEYDIDDAIAAVTGHWDYLGYVQSVRRAFR